MIVRLVVLAVLLVAVLLSPLSLVALYLVGYVAWYRGYELIPFMVLIDAYFGMWPQAPYLTFMAVAAVILAALIKPLLRVYTREV